MIWFDHDKRWRSFFDGNFAEQIATMGHLSPDNPPLEIEFTTLESWDPQLAHAVLKHSSEFIKSGNYVLSTLCKELGHEISTQIAITKLPPDCNSVLSEIGSEYVGKLSKTRAVVISISDLEPVPTLIMYNCPLCGTTYERKCDLFGQTNPPTKCDRESGCGKKVKFTKDEQHDDVQWAVVQELVQDIDKRKTPQRRMVMVKGNMINTLHQKMAYIANIITEIKEEKGKREFVHILHSLEEISDLDENEPIFIDTPYVPREMRARVYKKCHGMCQANWIIDDELDKLTNEICTELGSFDEPLEVDHIYPRKLGGATEFSNLQLLCKKHNRDKSNKVYHLHH